jgi:hypothetical protein
VSKENESEETENNRKKERNGEKRNASSKPNTKMAAKRKLIGIEENQ